jgi:hypothetical protein
VYQLCRHLERYFIVYCTEADVRERRFPKFNIDFLIQGIENNNLSLSHSYGPIFAHHHESLHHKQENVVAVEAEAVVAVEAQHRLHEKEQQQQQQKQPNR